MEGEVTFDELDTSSQSDLRALFQSQRNQIVPLFIAAGADARKYLFFTNSGGAIALLSFMGASEKVRENTSSWWTLACFFLGLLAVAVLHAINFHQTHKLTMAFTRDCNAVLQSQISFEEFDRRRSATKVSAVAAILSGYIAFACFVAGVVIAISRLMP